MEQVVRLNARKQHQACDAGLIAGVLTLSLALLLVILRLMQSGCTSIMSKKRQCVGKLITDHLMLSME